MENKNESGLQKRRNIRLKTYDYTQAGVYYVTICSFNRRWFFGSITEGVMRPNEIGNLVTKIWFEIPTHFPNTSLDAFVLMPNHLHGLVIIEKNTEQSKNFEQFSKPVKGSLGTIIRSFKAASTKKINDLRKTPGETLWQRGFYEHVVRNDLDLNRIREYIENNPLKWNEDELFVSG